MTTGERSTLLRPGWSGCRRGRELADRRRLHTRGCRRVEGGERKGPSGPAPPTVGERRLTAGGRLHRCSGEPRSRDSGPVPSTRGATRQMFKVSPPTIWDLPEKYHVNGRDSLVARQCSCSDFLQSATLPGEMNGDSTRNIEDIVRRNVAALRSKANLTQQGLADEMLLEGHPLDPRDRRPGRDHQPAPRLHRGHCRGSVPRRAARPVGSHRSDFRRCRRERVDRCLPGCGHRRNRRGRVPARNLRLTAGASGTGSPRQRPDARPSPSRSPIGAAALASGDRGPPATKEPGRVAPRHLRRPSRRRPNGSSAGSA